MSWCLTDIEEFFVCADDSVRFMGGTACGPPHRFAPPELLEDGELVRRDDWRQFATQKTDIHELGFLLREVIIDEWCPEGGYWKPLREDVPQDYRDIISLCQATRPEDRPSARHVLNLLLANC